eukprot:m.154628 g.154628  ORF g.154628 m.154628 type:complete len:93 (-) comp23522_c0_seq1:309-587(-)
MDVDGHDLVASAAPAASPAAEAVPVRVSSGSDYTAYGNLVSMITALTHRARAPSAHVDVSAGPRRDDSKRRVGDDGEDDQLETEQHRKIATT